MKNFISYGGKRKAIKNQLVAVHWNSHKGLYSIVEMKSANTIGIVLGYAKQVTLKNCYPKIDKTKQAKVRREKAKDRHAFIVGRLENCEVERLDKKIFYRPYDVDSFVDADKYFKENTIEYIEDVERVNLDHDGKKPLVTYSEHTNNKINNYPWEDVS